MHIKAYDQRGKQRIWSVRQDKGMGFMIIIFPFIGILRVVNTF